jgi:glycosyltransferase involved in cell wall biosynthesis
MVSTSDELDATALKRHTGRLDLVCAATASIAARAARTVGEQMVTVLPLGVPVPSRRDTFVASPQSLAIAGSGRDVGAYRAVFAAIADVMPALPEFQVAIELPTGHDPRLWSLAREFGIQRVLNGVSRLETVRPLALACGVFALPEATHGVRSIVLEAMGLGRTVVAMADPFADHLVHGVTALVVQERDAREWTTQLTTAMLDPQIAGAVGNEGAVRTASTFGSARCAELLAGACESILRGPSIPFPSANTVKP